MAINLAEKFVAKVAEQFAHQSFSGGMASKAYDWDGVKSIKVYSVDTVPYGNYTRSGTSRYGTPVELSDYVQTMEMTQDKGAAWTIDKGNAKEQYNIKKANETLKRQTDQRTNPMVDKYSFEKWAKGAGLLVVANAAITANTALGWLQDATEKADDNAFPEDGRFCACTNAYAKLLKQNPNFVYTDKLAGEALVRGEIGMLDGWRIVRVPTSYLPTGVHALCMHSSAILNPVKLKDYKIHIDPPGINGNLVETRVLFDAFVLDAKAKGVIAILASNASFCTAPTIAANGNITALGGTVVYYTVDGSDPRNSGTRAVASATGVVGNNGETITAIAYNSSATCAYSNYVTVTRTS